jgi:Right handed beta helix region/RTX calcium-binding nonapeptide repeat (4 copies)
VRLDGATATTKWGAATKRRRLVALALTALALLIAAESSPPASATGACDRYAAPSGSDSAPGSVAQPLRSVQRLVDALEPGQVGCLRAGTYVDDEPVKFRERGATLTAYPGESATVGGRIRVDSRADGTVIEGLSLDGRNPENLHGPLIYADNVVLRGNDITNHHMGICVNVTREDGERAPRNVVIEGNRIHDCGELPATNHHHGIYIAKAVGTVVRGNWIYSNADRGVQLYPNADESIVTRNVIDGNGQGVIFGGGETSSSDNNLVARNVITHSNLRHNVESHWQGPTGVGNVARENCVYGGARPANGGIETPHDGFVARGNRTRDPGFEPAARDFRLPGGSMCAGALRVTRKGTQGRDRLAGTPGPDSIVGLGDDDRLIGRAGNDRIVGGAGNDRIRPGGGRDVVRAGSGRDRVDSRGGGRDVVRCGPGKDRAKVDRRDRVRGCERVRRPD